MPDIVGWQEAEAEAVLREQGFRVARRQVTVPPAGTGGGGSLRVVRQRLLAAAEVEVVLAGEMRGAQNVKRKT